MESKRNLNVAARVPTITDATSDRECGNEPMGVAGWCLDSEKNVSWPRFSQYVLMTIEEAPRQSSRMNSVQSILFKASKSSRYFVRSLNGLSLLLCIATNATSVVLPTIEQSLPASSQEQLFLERNIATVFPRFGLHDVLKVKVV